MSNFSLTMFGLFASVLLLSPAAVSANGCPRGSFLDSTSSECTLCPPGSYQQAKNSSNCIPCEPGQYLAYAGAQSYYACRICPAGTFSSAGSESCTACPENTTSMERSPRCVHCPKGTFVSYSLHDPRAVACQSCRDGYADEENLLQCKRCPPGFAAPPGAVSIDQCKPCAAGTASDHYNGCQQCQPGTFSGPASSECTLCPAGSESEKTFGSTKCIPCNPGQYGRIVRGIHGFYPTCFGCPENTTSFTSGRRFCRRIDGPCPSGYIQTSTGDCERCEVDERYDLEEERCVRCSRNEGSIGGLPLTCAPCAKVIESEVLKSHCVPWDHLQNFPIVSQTCAPGTHIHDTEFARFCLPCDPGYFSTEPNSSECIQCPDGLVALGYGEAICESCPEGMVADSASSQCVDRETNCPADTQFVVEDDHGHCVPIECSVSEDGSYSCPQCSGSLLGLRLGSEKCEPCPGNQVRDDGLVCGCRGTLAQNLGIINGACSECPAGSYGRAISDGGDNACTMCPAGTYRVVATSERMLGSVCPRCTQNKPCQKCPPGFVTKRDGATECEQCPSGTFSYGVGDRECLSFGAASRPVRFNHPLDLEVQRELGRFPEWWEVFLTGEAQ